MGKNKEFKISKKLDPYVRDYYKYEIGTPDLTQNWLELFHGTVIDDLFTIMHNNSDNQLKSDYVEELLEPFGFTSKGGGLGTNILVLTHPYYPGVVFKIALDENGIADNFNDCLLQDMIPQYSRVYARHPSGLVTVQERYFVMKPEWMVLYRNDILHTLRKLSEDYLIADLTPSMVLNYGIDRKGNFVFIDGSDLYPLKQIKAKDRLRCVAVTGSDKNGELKRCRGKCKYNDDFSQLICEKCGRTYIPIELRPRKEDADMKNIFSDGFTLDDREELERRTRVAIETNQPLERYIPDRILHQNDEEDEESMTLPEGYHVQIWRQGKDKLKIAVMNGYHVVAIDKDGNPIVKPDKVDRNDKPMKNSDKVEKFVKNKRVVHDMPDTIRVPQEVQTYDNPDPEPPKRNPKPSESLMERIQKFKETNPEGYQNYVKELIEFIGWDIIDSFREKPDTDYESMIENLHTEVDNRDKVIRSLRDSYNELQEKVDEMSKLKAENVYYFNMAMKLEKELKSLKDDVIKNEDTNNIIPQEGDDPNCIRYQVVSSSNDVDLPGIYYHIYGDVAKAYEKYGLPIYVTVDGYNSVILAANTIELQQYIYDAYDDALEDSNEMPTIDEPDDSDEEPAPDANEPVPDNTQEELLKSYTTILDEDEDNDDGEISEEEEEEILTRITQNSNPNYDPRYDNARDWADRI